MDDPVLRRLEELERQIASLKAEVLARSVTNQDQPTAVPPPTLGEAAPDAKTKPAWSRGEEVAQRGGLEARIGSKWLAIAGITLLVLALAYFFQLAISNGWIGLTMQIILGVTLGVLLWGAGAMLHRAHKLTGFAQVLAAGGVAITAFAVFAAYHLESYRAATGLSLMGDSLLLAAVGLGAAVDAVLRRVPVQAGVAAALVVWTALAALDLTIFSLAYTVGMVAVLLAAGAWRGWAWMAAATAPAAATVLAAHLVQETAAWAVLASVVAVHGLTTATAWRRQAWDPSMVAGHVVSWMMFWILGGIALVQRYETQHFAWWSLGTAAVGYLAASVVPQRHLRIVATIIATIAAVTAPVFVEHDALRVPLWLAMLVAAEALRRWRGWATAMGVRPVLLVAIFVHAVVFELGDIEARRSGWQMAVAVLAATAGASVVGWQGERSLDKSQAALPTFSLAMSAVILSLTAAALWNGVFVSVAWAVLAIGYVAAGFATDEAPLRITGLALFAVMLGRIVFVDLAGVEAVWRVLAFIAIAAILLLASWLYVRRGEREAA